MSKPGKSLAFTSLLTPLIAALALVVATACGGGSTETAEVKKPVEEKPLPIPEGGESQLDPGPDAEQVLTWMLAKLNSGGELTEAEATQWLAPGFLEQVPYAEFARITKELATALPPIKVLDKKADGALKLSVLLDTAQGGMRLSIEVNNKVPRQVEGMLIRPAATEAPPKDYGQARVLLEKSGSDVMLSVSEIKKNQCTPVVNLNATSSLAIGSTFKLWVLAALDRKLSRSKKLTWDDKIKIDDAFKSLPSGVLQNQPAGTELTLREFATKMISISDNTATDHLINYVGRGEVEKMLKLAKHSKPAANTPFFMTREMFALKLAASEKQVDAYRRASVAAKRKLLPSLREKEIKLEMAKDWTAPRMLDLEWFANGVDLCNVMATIGKASKWSTDSEVLKVLAVNPGVEFDKEQWKYVGYKGGSEPGVINLSFLGQRQDDRWFVITLSVNDKEKAVNEAAVANVATGLLKIVGAEK